MSDPTIYIEETPDNFVNILDPKMEEKLTVDTDTGIDTCIDNNISVAKIENVNVGTDDNSKNTFDHVREHVQNEIETEIPEKSENYADDDVEDDVDEDNNDDEDVDEDDDFDEDDSASTPSSLPDLVSVSESSDPLEPMQPMQPSPSAEKELVDFYKTNYMIMLGFLMYLLFLVICSYTLIVLHINKNC